MIFGTWCVGHDVMAGNILLTGSSGKLGKAIKESGLFPKLLTPSRKELDITDERSVSSYFSTHDFSVVIHCAALARMRICEQDPDLAAKTNIQGTVNLVNAALEKEKIKGKPLRFIYISTDGVYEGKKGHYKEDGPTIPYNTYGRTKLGAECAVHALKDHCIIRTSFFDPMNIPFDTAATDMYSSKMPLMELVNAIHFLAHHSFVGVINIGAKKMSEYDRYKTHNPSINPSTFSEIQGSAPFPLAKDASMDISTWKGIKGKPL